MTARGKWTNLITFIVCCALVGTAIVIKSVLVFSYLREQDRLGLGALSATNILASLNRQFGGWCQIIAVANLLVMMLLLPLVRPIRKYHSQCLLPVCVLAIGFGLIDTDPEHTITTKILAGVVCCLLFGLILNGFLLVITVPPPQTTARSTCPNCGYRLFGLTGTICPECGGTIPRPEYDLDELADKLNTMTAAPPPPEVPVEDQAEDAAELL